MAIVSDVSTAPRLPTRCPGCKGAVIQRMAGSSHGGFIWFHCFFCNHPWKFRLDDARANLNGDAITDDALKEHLHRKTVLRELESGKLQRRIDSVAGALGKVQAEEERLWKILKQDEDNLRKSRAWSVAYNKMKNLTKEVEDLIAELQHLTSEELVTGGRLEDLPPIVSRKKK
jgi:hypothetical protein